MKRKRGRRGGGGGGERWGEEVRQGERRGAERSGGRRLTRGGRFKETGKWLADEMNTKHIRRQWGGYHIPNGVQDLLNESEKVREGEVEAWGKEAGRGGGDYRLLSWEQERMLGDPPVDLIPRFMLDAEGKVLPEYRPVAELVQSVRRAGSERGGRVMRVLSETRDYRATGGESHELREAA
eukprot:762409-Hanusia_phi.AAC.2